MKKFTENQQSLYHLSMMYLMIREKISLVRDEVIEQTLPGGTPKFSGSTPPRNTAALPH